MQLCVCAVVSLWLASISIQLDCNYMLSFSLSHEESLFIIMAPLRAFVALPSLVINNADMPNGEMNYCHLTLLEIQKDWKILLSRFNFFFFKCCYGPTAALATFSSVFHTWCSDMMTSLWMLQTCMSWFFLSSTWININVNPGKDEWVENLTWRKCL